MAARDRQLTIRFTETELTAIEHAAAADERTPGAMVRRLIGEALAARLAAAADTGRYATRDHIAAHLAGELHPHTLTPPTPEAHA